MANGYDEPEYSSGRYRGGAVIEEHGQRINTLEAKQGDIERRVSATAETVSTLREQLGSIIKEAASNQAAVTTQLSQLSAAVGGVKSTLDMEAGARAERARLAASTDRLMKWFPLIAMAIGFGLWALDTYTARERPPTEVMIEDRRAP
jgi:hypothetical protein